MKRADNTIAVSLLDCTLGSSGKQISWHFKESRIRTTLSLIQRSGIELVEYGSLCSYTRGPEYSIFSSTVLPLYIDRQPDRLYAVSLDRYSRPLLSSIPLRSSCTADIVRVWITPDGVDAELAYCSALSEKNYDVVALIEETGQYSEEALTGLLRRIRVLQLWGCYIFDTSGVLDVDRLRTLLSIYDNELPANTRIGFHGTDSLMRGMEIAKLFVQFDTAHQCCVDVSSGGIGPGATHLPTQCFASWMNEMFHREYDLSVLAYLEHYFKSEIQKKEDAEKQFLYHAAAMYNCTYQYVDYFCEFGIEPHVQMDLFPEIPREAAFRFEKEQAHRALLRYRKRTLNLAIVVITADHPDLMDNLIYASRDLLKYGVNLVILDNSSDERTYAIVRNYQLCEYTHVLYRRSTSGGSYTDRVVEAFTEHLNYDYIWLLRDDLIPTIPQFYFDLLSFTQEGMDLIVVDAAFRNQQHTRKTRYRNYLAMFEENSARLSIIGTTIVRSAFMKQVLAHQPTSCGHGDFWMPAALLRELTSVNASTGLIVSDVFRYNGDRFAQSFFNDHILQTWAQDWYLTISELPEEYAPYKVSAVRIQMEDVYPFRLKSLLYLRSTNNFGISQYRHWKSRLEMVGQNADWVYRFAALVPKSIARKLAWMADYQGNSLMGKVAKKLRSIARLGR